jgi:prepilin peptidase CpaA
MSIPAFILLSPLLVALVVAAGIDARSRRIPNWLTVSLLAAGLVRSAMWGSAAGVAVPGIGMALLGMLVGGMLLIPQFALRAVGGGDVKLFAALGAWLGPWLVFSVFVVQAVVGLIIVLIQAISQRKILALFRNSALIAANLAFAPEIGIETAISNSKTHKSIGRPLPYAVPVLIATLIILFAGKYIGR